MLSTKEPTLMWAFVSEPSGFVFHDGWAATEPVATDRSRGLIDSPNCRGGLRLCRVTVEVCTPEETEDHRAAFAEWKVQRDKRNGRTSRDSR